MSCYRWTWPSVIIKCVNQPVNTRRYSKISNAIEKNNLRIEYIWNDFCKLNETQDCDLPVLTYESQDGQ